MASTALALDPHDELVARLRRIRSGDEPRPISLDLAGARLIGEDLRGLNFSGWDLQGTDLSRAQLDGCRFVKSKLAGASFFEASLQGAELLGADLAGAVLSAADCSRVGFGHAVLRQVQAVDACFEGATFTEADLQDADLRASRFHGARFVEADLRGASFEASSLGETDLEGARLDGACFHRADLRRARLRGVRGYPTAGWVHADVRDVDWNGAWLVRRHVLDENFLHEFRNASPAHARLYTAWRLTSDCGRSLTRWGAWTAGIAVVFALVYTQVGIDFGDSPTWLSPLYFSVVTLTTLGYGDALPTSVSGQVAVMMQVVLGYGMLGGLLSIFSTKMGRRAD